MSLTQRVAVAGNAASLDSRTESAEKVGELKRKVQNHLPPETIARMARENPLRAENELRAVSAAVLEGDMWFAEGAAERERLVDALVDSVFGLGPLQALLDDDTVTEIMVNSSKSLFIERDGLLESCDSPFTDDDQVRALIDRIIGPLGRRIDESSPMVNARLSQGHRVHAVIPPIAIDGPVLTIRKFRDRVIGLDEMVELGTCDQAMKQFLTWCVKTRRNLAVSGGTGSGKTTLLNALSCEIDAGERIVTIEDSAELKFSEHPHVVRLEARPRNAEGTGEVTIRELVTNSLRMRPDRIIVGECRGPEAMDMLQAMNTGHDGSLTTLHANTPADAIMRLSTMVRYAADLPIGVIEGQISSALDCIVQVARAQDGHRFVSDVIEVGYDRVAGRCEVKPLYAWKHAQDQGVWLDCPTWVDEMRPGDADVRKEVATWKRLVRLPS